MNFSSSKLANFSKFTRFSHDSLYSTKSILKPFSLSFITSSTSFSYSFLTNSILQPIFHSRDLGMNSLRSCYYKILPEFLNINANILRLIINMARLAAPRDNANFGFCLGEQNFCNCKYISVSSSIFFTPIGVRSVSNSKKLWKIHSYVKCDCK